MARDHDRLDELLSRAAADIDVAAYQQFRAGLLHHIAMEEEEPAARDARGGRPLSIATRTRLEHGALAALLVPTPSTAIVATIRRVLADHNPIEENPGGLYELCEEVIGFGLDIVLSRLRAMLPIPVASHKDGPLVMTAARRAVERAGYTLDA